MDSSGSGLRQRHSIISDDLVSEDQQPAWQAQLSAARAGLAERVRRQQELDGFNVNDTTNDDAIGDEIAHGTVGSKPSDDDATNEAASSPHDSVPSKRRGSDCSLLSEASDADDQVHEMLTGYKSRKSVAEPLQDVVEEPGPEARPSARPVVDDPELDKCCRICFSDDVEDPDLGKLLSPCRCRGTSRYVHQGCLKRWRAASANSASFYECDQCKYRYQFRRTRIASLVTHPATLLSVTCILFTMLIYVAGFMANRMIAIAERRAMSGSMFDEWFVSDHVILSEGVREAVDFIGKRVEDVAQDRVQDPSTSWILSWVLHFTKGLSLVGLMSLFQAYIATSFFSPLGRGFYRMMRPAARRGGRNTGANSMSQLVIVLLVVVGAAKAIRTVYYGTKWLSKRVLSRIEDLVLDIGPT